MTSSKPKNEEGIEFTDALYRENILDHYRNPRNFGRIDKADAEFHGNNPICGDEIELTLKISAGKIMDARFMGRGCAVSQSAASMLTERIIGMPVKEALRLSRDDIIEMMGISPNPTRLKCALLSLKVMEGAFAKLQGKTQ